MVYCEKCKVLSETGACPVCGSRRLRIPTDGDYCFLTRREAMWASMLEDVLKDNGIPAVCLQELDEAYGLRRFEWARVYVPYRDYEQAKEWMKELFDSGNGSEEIGKDTDDE